MKIITNILYYVLIFFLVIYVLVLALNPSKMIDVVGFRTFFVLSTSMEPRINVNDMIIITRTSEDKLEEGDIITFEVYIPELDSYDYVTHYIAKIDSNDDGTFYETRRHLAAEDVYDEWEDEDGNVTKITFDDIEGRYLFKIPYVGYIQDALQNRIIIGLLLFNGGVIYLLVSYLRKDDEEYEDEDDDE